MPELDHAVVADYVRVELPRYGRHLPCLSAKRRLDILQAEASAAAAGELVTSP
jgi:hypothetical protein